jgi:zinc transport system substrate-binding protein
MRLIIKTYFVPLLMLAWLGSPAYASSSPVEGLSIAASIKPVAMLVKAVVGDEVPVQVLLPANASPHEYALKFSDLRLMKQAGLVVWVGPELEGVLVKALKTIPLENQLQLTQVNAMEWPGQNPDADHHGHSHNHADHSKQKSSQSVYQDPHLWLNPHNSMRAVQAIAVALANKYPQHKAMFEVNAGQFSENIELLDNTIQQKLQKVKERGFVVTHDGYRHFVDYYGLNQLSAIQLSSGAGRGARHYGDIVALGGEVACVFTEPQLNNKAAIQLSSKLGANQKELDIIGRKIPLDQQSYLTFFQAFSDTFVECLGNKGH